MYNVDALSALDGQPLQYQVLPDDRPPGQAVIIRGLLDRGSGDRALEYRIYADGALEE